MSHATDIADRVIRTGSERDQISRLARPAGAVSGLFSPSKPKITIVMPVYNAAKTLDRAVQSLRAQSFDAWEAVLVDDGSADDSFRLCKAWAARDRRICAITQSNAGVSAARNRGIEAAQGDWLLFLDSDDYLHRHALKRLIAAARANPEAQVVAGRAARVDAGGRAWRFPRWDLSDPFSVLSGECALVIHSALVRRARALAVGGFDESLQTSEDWDFWQKIARTGAGFHQIEPLVAYYQSNPGSLSKRVRQLVTNTFEVMRRGHRADPRVPNPLAAYADGASAGNLSYLQLNFVLWSAGRDIAGGGEGVSLLDLLDPAVLTAVDAEPEHVGEMIAAGMADLQSVQPEVLGVRWPEIGPKLVGLLRAAYPDAARARQRDMVLLTVKNRFGVRIDQGGADECPTIARATLELGGALRRSDGEGHEAVCVQILHQGRPLGLTFAPQLAERSDADLAQVALAQFSMLPMTTVAPVLKPWRSPRFWLAATQDLVRIDSLGVGAMLRHDPGGIVGLLRERMRHVFISGAEAAVRAGVRVDQRQASPHQQRLAGLRTGSGPAAAPAFVEGKPPLPDRMRSRSAWNAYFTAEDPWANTAPYEEARHAQILELIPREGVRSALELGCARGHFTIKLAQRVGRLLAVDVSDKAIEAAAARCLGLPNVELESLDVVSEPLASGQDLIVCSEVLYHLGGPRLMRRVARKLAAALNPGGLIVLAHSNQVIDDPAHSGFDAGHKFGAKTISDTFSALPDLELAREIRTPLYRLQAFRKRALGLRPLTPLVEQRPLSTPPPADVAKQIIWDGAKHSRVEALRTRMTSNLPILMYHRVASDGPASLARWRVTPDQFAEQIKYLRSQGYWTVTPEQWAQAMARNTPLPGRPIMLTFDDAYEDFGEHAWPILKAHDFTAALFVVAGKVGGTADWDAVDGEAAPLLSWHGLRRLAQEGVSIGAHGYSHRPMSRLTAQELYDEGLQTRARIIAEIGQEPMAFCYPYGASDRVVGHAMNECGYTLAFSCTPGVASLSSNPTRLPRIEITGGDDLVTFSRKIGRPLS